MLSLKDCYLLSVNCSGCTDGRNRGPVSVSWAVVLSIVDGTPRINVEVATEVLVFIHV